MEPSSEPQPQHPGPEIPPGLPEPGSPVPAEHGLVARATEQGPAEPAAAPAVDEPPPREGIKETIESILVAFILAFVFRAFIVEAFVIPSGSMATTLLGGHMRFRCEECGFQFDVNYPAKQSDDSLAIPSVTPPTFSMHCDNCGFPVKRTDERSAERSELIPVRYGDRILVLKYLYLLQDPRRWDVVVFKTPTQHPDNEHGRVPERPELDYAQNFIKRLVGLPGESLMLLDGDVYARPAGFAGKRPEGWLIQRKSAHAQEALWRVVFDNDFQPRNAGGRRWVNPWKQADGAGWKVPPGGRILTFDNAAGAGTLRFDKDANPNHHPLSDRLSYNETKPVESLTDDYYGHDYYAEEQDARRHIPRWNVSDLKLAFAYERTSGDGPLRAALTKLGHTFSVAFTPAEVTFTHVPAGGGPQSVLTRKRLDAPAGTTLNVELANVDYRVTVRVNGKVVIDHAWEPDVADLLRRHDARRKTSGPGGDAIREHFPAPTVSLSAEKQACTVAHLALWRDIYYTPGNGYWASNAHSHGTPDNPIVLRRKGDYLPGLGKAGENEYFVLGDNSILSGDARGWIHDVDLRESEDLYIESGRVPERFLLGKAFFVYWPAGYRPLGPNSPGIVPNFGEMRFIH